ncbi:hypothetical protein SeMB42_g04519 [Synchytrium endobioticum]|uniref:Elongation factor 1 alpha-like protein n=1 Tax=Synchytrium endobioticum TaxID=286115 RepID=A0A507CXN8_9FUNG|nr:hypothetical protein SeMB42_g04519 [Synchytrium endobioticum]TPX45600.1 hypothetical protein SeLEV6574_g03775 [Synchytrium endobioticum]
MSRHRNIRNMDLHDELDDYADDLHGTSYDDGASPPDRDYIYNRDVSNLHTMASYMPLDDQPEHNDHSHLRDDATHHEHDDRVFHMDDVQTPQVSAKEQVKAVLGPLIPDLDIDLALQRNCGDAAATIDHFINQTKRVQDVKAIVGSRYTDAQLIQVLAKNRNNVQLTVNEILDAPPPAKAPPGLSRPTGLPAPPPGLASAAANAPPGLISTQTRLTSSSNQTTSANGTAPPSTSVQSAAPSSLAQALFKAGDPRPSVSLVSLPCTNDAMTVSSLDVAPFSFDSPSPDDIVADARAKAVASRPPQRSSISINSRAPAIFSPNKVDQAQQDLVGLKITSAPSTPSAQPSKPPLPQAPAMTRTGSGSNIIFPVMARTASSGGVLPSRSIQSASISKPSPKMSRKLDIAGLLEKRSAEKKSLNLVVIGHVDAGKSTIMGHLLYLLGEVSDRTIKKYERDADKIGKASFRFAWVLDETDEERSRGITMDVAITKFETDHRKFTLLDAPGHKDFIPNMISGAAQADVAMLVIGATTGEFETGFESGGQTKEHALLVRSLGVSQMLIAINKMDATNWDKASGFTSGNLVSRVGVGGLNSWYNGPTLKEQLDKLEVPERPIDKPFRMSVSDFFKGGIGTGGGGSVSMVGRIEAGSIQMGENVLLMPNGEVGVVRALEIGDEAVKWAAAGDTILMSLASVDTTNMSSGTVICDPSAPIPLTTRIRARIVTFDVAVVLTIGVKVVFHQKSLTEPAYITKLLEILDKSTGQVIKKNPRALPKNTTATVEIKVDRSICLETFQDSKELGRFMLRTGGNTVAAGIVTEILSFERVVGGGMSASNSQSQLYAASS